MTRFILNIACIFILSSGCSKDEEPGVSLRAKNVGSKAINIFLLQGETLRYENIGIGETTDYQAWIFGNRKPDMFEVRTASGGGGPLIVNYTPEGGRLENGSYTMEVDEDFNVLFVKD